MNLLRLKYANCFIWAFYMQWAYGGYICWRKSMYGWWPHAVWSLDRITWYEYLPLNFSGELKWWQVLWLVLFKGSPRVVTREAL